MKQILFHLMFLALFLSACSGGEIPQTEVRTFTESLMTEYPNFESNDMAKSAISEAIKAKAETLIDQPTTFFKDVKFNFIKMLELEDGLFALFECREFCEIDAPKNSSNKYLIANGCAQVLGKVDEATAAKLDRDVKYYISGTIEGWVADPLPCIGSHCAIPGVSTDGIFLGAFSVKDLTVTEAPAEK